MQKIIFISFLFFSLCASGQACKKYIESDATDPFTGQPAIFTQRVVYSQPTLQSSRSISFRVLDNNRLFFHLTSGSGQDIVLGSDVLVKFEDGEEMTLRIEQALREKEGTEFVSHGNCRIYSKEDAMRFYEHKIVAIQLLGSRLDFEIDKTDQTNIIAGALCLIEQVGIDNFDFSSERKTQLVPDATGASFISGGSSVTVSGTIKCEYVTDTVNANNEVERMSKPKDLVTSPYKLVSQIGKKGDKITLYLTYGMDLGNINANSTVSFKFKNGTIMQFKHSGDAIDNSKPTFQIDLSLYKDEFLKDDLSAIRLSYSEYFADLFVSAPRYLSDYIRYCLQ